MQYSFSGIPFVQVLVHVTSTLILLVLCSVGVTTGIRSTYAVTFICPDIS